MRGYCEECASELDAYEAAISLSFHDNDCSACIKLPKNTEYKWESLLVRRSFGEAATILCSVGCIGTGAGAGPARA